MPTPRSIQRSILAPDVNMGPITLKQPLPAAGLRQVDPFLLIHHMGPKQQTPGGESVLGIGAHPHRGFEPVTFIFKGDVHHRDSYGNDSIIKAGGVQWMTAGSGVVHSENASEEFVAQGGELELIQLWINLPASLKMSEPRYQGFQESEIPFFTNDDQTLRLNVVSGSFGDLQGPVESLTGITAYTLSLEPGSQVDIPEQKNRSVLLYQLHGKAEVNGETSTDHTMLTFGQDGELLSIKATAPSLFLYISGEPINERVATYGPFVMNSQDEIVQAVQDFQTGKMGALA